MKYKELDISIPFNEEDSKKHIEEDYNVINEEGIDNIIKNKFIPWLLGDQFKDRDIDKVFEGLKVYEVSYYYGRIVAKYSPTNEDNYFGQFEFCFNSCNDYTNDILEAAAMYIYVLNGSIVKVGGYDI